MISLNAAQMITLQVVGLETLMYGIVGYFP